MKLERDLNQKEGLGYRYNYKLLQQSWLARKLAKLESKKQTALARKAEVEQYGMSVHGLRQEGQFVWL
jgi:hypothetical protein